MFLSWRFFSPLWYKDIDFLVASLFEVLHTKLDAFAGENILVTMTEGKNIESMWLSNRTSYIILRLLHAAQLGVAAQKADQQLSSYL